MGTNYVKKSRTQRLPLVTSTHLNQFSKGVASEKESYICNGIILQYPDQKYYVTQRPTITTIDDPDDLSITNNRGRGIYYWDDTGPGLYVEADYVAADYVEGGDTPALYIINANEIYKDTYNTVTSGATITTGIDKIYAAELSDLFVFLDTENNEMWYVKAGSASVLKKMNFSITAAENFTFSASTITTTSNPLSVDLAAGDVFTLVTASGTNDGDYTYVSQTGTSIVVEETFTTEGVGTSSTIHAYPALPQNNNLTLAHGLVVLDQTMYVLDTTGKVWGSALADAQDWTDALNVITAEKEEDQGVYIAKHYDSVVVFGRRTIEFLYDAGNPTGSPLSIRQDISYNIGLADPASVWRYQDDIYFLGRDNTGQTLVYVLRDYKIEPISTSTLSSFFSQNGYTFFGSGFQAGGNVFYTLSAGQASSGDLLALETHVYNVTTNTWTEWDYSVGTPDKFPMISNTAIGGISTGYGQFTTGEVFKISDTLTPDEDGTDLTMIIRVNHFDANSRDWKYGHQMRYVGDSTVASQNITIKWADDNNTSYSSGRTIDISDSKNKLTRLGRFKSRSHEVEYSGSEQIRIEALDLDITEGTH